MWQAVPQSKRQTGSYRTRRDRDVAIVEYRLRADEETTKIPVVAVTASVTMQDQSQITRAGFDAFISKPISVKEFLETVNQIVGKPT